MKSPGTGRSIWRSSRELLQALSLSCALMVSGCASNSQMPRSAQSQVVVDPTLMAEPSYQTDLLNFLSDKHEKPTSK